MKKLTLPILVLLTWSAGALAAVPAHEVVITVDPLGVERFRRPVEAPIDLTAYMDLLAATLEPATMRVVETDGAGFYLDLAVPFQFDPAPGFDGTTNAAGTLVFLPADAVTGLPKTAWPEGVRTFKLLFDVVGGCAGCPGPPPVPEPVAVDSLTYENQLTYKVATPGGDWYYHADGAGFASLIDVDQQDWISFRDIPGSKSAGEFRGIPNLVFVPGQSSQSFFHPGFTNASSWVVSSGPLKTVIRSQTDDPANRWVLRWDFFPRYARMTVEQVGTSNGGDYWFLYEGTVGGNMDADDVVVRSDGTVTSAFDYAGKWEEALAEPEWTAFRDTTAQRYLYVSNDVRDTALDSYRPQGQTSSSTPEMTVFGLGRVLNTTTNSLVPRMSGAGRTFTVGLGENPSTMDETIASATRPVGLTVGAPTAYVAAAPGDLPARPLLAQNHPNPFNPRTSIDFVLPAASLVRLEVFDARGRRVDTLVEGPLPAGPHTRVFDGVDRASGLYLYRLTTDRGVEQRKMLLLR
jgi:hypothetical protein